MELLIIIIIIIIATIPSIASTLLRPSGRPGHTKVAHALYRPALAFLLYNIVPDNHKLTVVLGFLLSIIPIIPRPTTTIVTTTTTATIPSTASTPPADPP